MQTARRKGLAVCSALLFGTFFLYVMQQQTIYYQTTLRKDDRNITNLPIRQDNWRGLTANQRSSLSKLGELLYLDAKYPRRVENKTYKILLWKYGKALERRHIYSYSKKQTDAFSQCSVKNCKISYLDKDLPNADLVLFHLHRIADVKSLPKRTGSTNQIWTFLTDESPFHTFLHRKGNSMANYNGLFNWSMTYRMDSDIPVPYGRTLLLKKASAKLDFDEWSKSKKQDVLIAIMGSNCGGSNHRWQYVKLLQKYIDVDVYGGCGTLKCPGHFTKDCSLISKYKFYLSFENSNCREYITEKLWWNGYSKNAVPIVMGGARSTYKQLLPPNSFINVEDFASPSDLANYIIYLNNTPSELKQFFSWKERFRIVNEHGYFGSKSFHYCRICEALNYNKKGNKVYSNLENFWSKHDCTASTWDVHGK